MKTLTATQYELLARLADGDLAPGEELLAQKLAKTPAGETFLNELAVLEASARLAEEAIWEKSTLTPETILAGIDQPATLELRELKPLLERFFDGECDEVEAEWVAELVDTRDDVAEYLVHLETMQAGIRIAEDHLGAAAGFDGFFQSVMGRIEESDAGLSVEEKVLVTRYFDDEVNDTERARVSALLESNQDAKAMFDALGEIRLATTASMDTVCEGVDFSSIWESVEDAMNEDQEAAGDNVVSLGKRKKETFFQQYRQSIIGAVAALVVVAFAGALIGPFAQPERVIVEKTVVIVDSVEYAPGASVMINSPVQQASSISEASSETEEEPTVIWLLDSGEENLEEESEAPRSGQPI